MLVRIALLVWITLVIRVVGVTLLIRIRGRIVRVIGVALIIRVIGIALVGRLDELDVRLDIHARLNMHVVLFTCGRDLLLDSTENIARFLLGLRTVQNGGVNYAVFF